MQLTGPQLKRLHSLLLRAFPTYKELKRLALFGLDLNLDTIVDSHDLNAATFDLLEWSHAHDKDSALVASAVEANSDNQALRAFASESGILAAPTPAMPAPRYRTLVVDPLHRSDYSTISEAIAAAHPGDHISVRPGIYTEGLVIDKPLEIIGDGERTEIVVQTSGKNVVLFQASAGRVQNLTLRQTGGGSGHGVEITQGHLELEDCDIRSANWACVAIFHGAAPRLRRNSIHGGKQSGVLIRENGQGLLENNDIFANDHAGVQIQTGGNPTLRGNRIHDGNGCGVFVYENGQGLLQDNDIFANAQVGVLISTSGNPILRHNRIHDGKGGGVVVRENGQGLLEDNDIFANDYAGMTITTGGNPTLRGNRIHDGKQSGVFVYENGQGLLEDNDIFANAYNGVTIMTGGNPTLRSNRVHKNGYSAIRIYENGSGVIEDNDLRDNMRGAWDVARECLSNVKRSGNIE